MAEISVNFIHPIDGRLLTGSFDNTLTAQEVIDQLIVNEFIEKHEAGYYLVIKGTGEVIMPVQTFADARVVTDDNIRIVPSSNAGGHYVKNYDRKQRKGESGGIPGLDKTTVRSFPLKIFVILQRR